MDQKSLRQVLRKRRQSLNPKQQQQAQEHIAKIICALPIFKNSAHIALYFANDGEINPADIALEARRQHKTCYLPVIDKPNKRDMYFLPFKPDTPMQKNQYGIPEPVLPDSEIHYAADLDLILLPLTGFDEHGHRMGMGGGYYDRALSFKRTPSNIKKPWLLGLAHECQKVESLPLNDWDISLEGVVSDSRVY